MFVCYGRLSVAILLFGWVDDRSFRGILGYESRKVVVSLCIAVLCDVLCVVV